MPFCQESGGGQIKDDVRPLVGISALCSHQCFDVDGWGL